MLVVFGVISLILAIVCFTRETGSYEYNEIYGGDAYTGIQNAAAQSANNVLCLNRIVKTGFGSVLLVCGGVLIAAALPSDKGGESAGASVGRGAAEAYAGTYDRTAYETDAAPGDEAGPEI